jgi:hypothetical protein
LRKQDEFKAWDGAVAEPGKPSPTDKKRELCLQWDVVGAWAKRLAAEWQRRLQAIVTWSGVQFQDLAAWATQEEEVWRALAHWAAKPLEEDRRTAFWVDVATMLSGGESGNHDSLAPDPSKPELPTPRLDCKEPEPWQHARALAEDELHWALLRARARALRQCWEGRVVQVAEATAHPQRLPESTIESWARGSARAWQALKDWADDPADLEAIEEFRLRGECTG